MAKWADQYKKATETATGRRLSRQEQLLFDATELICRALANERISRVELAKRIGKSKAYVTQVLRGQNNMTLRTLSDLANALGYDVELGALNPSTSHRISVGHWNGLTRCHFMHGLYRVSDDLCTPSAVLPAPEQQYELAQAA